MAEGITTLYKYDTIFSADSVEWCPHVPYQNLFVCANYYLGNESNEKQQRLGKILLFSITFNDGLTLLQTIETVGVLDQKWCHNKVNNQAILGVVNAKGEIEIYGLSSDESVLILLTSYKVENEKPGTLMLSLDWSTGKYSSEEPEIICSDSNGSIHIFKLSNDCLSMLSSAKAHDFEAWIAAFYYWDTNIYFSGGDDCVFLKYDKRIGTDPIAKNKIHEAGVTCMHSNKQFEYIFATGSYDTYLRLWDIRYLKMPQKSLETPGTMWRIKWEPQNCLQLLVACMLGGVHIINNEGDDLEILQSYNEHKDIAYGADWCYLEENNVKEFDIDSKKIIGTCSFYDHLLCISAVK